MAGLSVGGPWASLSCGWGVSGCDGDTRILVLRDVGVFPGTGSQDGL